LPSARTAFEKLANNFAIPNAQIRTAPAMAHVNLESEATMGEVIGTGLFALAAACGDFVSVLAVS
jgi:hypothetical protein